MPRVFIIMSSPTPLPRVITSMRQLSTSGIMERLTVKVEGVMGQTIHVRNMISGENGVLALGAITVWLT